MTRRQIIPIALSTFLVAFSVAAAFDAPAPDWHIAGPFGGTATSLALDPQKPDFLLAGGHNSLVFRSEDAGEHWSLLDFPKRNLTEVTSVLVDPKDSNHLLAGIISADGGGMFASTDKGETWKVVPDVKDFGVRSIVASPSQPARFLSGTLHGVMLSDDSGATWKRVSDPKNLEMQGITATAIDPADANVLYAGTSHLPWKSIDGGQTWNSIHTGMSDDSDVFSIFVNPANPQNVFASACSGIYSSADRGDQWRKVMGLSFSQRRTHVIRKDPHTEGVIYAGTTMGLFKSPNLGTTWKLISKEQVNAMLFDPAHPGSMYMAMEYEGISRGTDAGEKISMLNHGFVDRPIAAVTQVGNRLLAVETQLGESTGLFESKDQGENWSPLTGIQGLGGVHLKSLTAMPGDGKVLVGASVRQIYKSINGGQLWKPLTVRLIVPPAPVKTPAPAAKPRTSSAKSPARKAPARKPVEVLRPVTLNEVYGLYSLKNGAKGLLFAATDFGLLKSADAGERWTLVDVAGASGVNGIFLPPNADGRMVARANGGLFLSKDFGEQWTALHFPTATGDVNDVALAAETATPILVATRLGLYSSGDEGAQWVANPGGLTASTINSVVFGAGGLAYAVQYGKLWESKDSGGSWSRIASTLPPPRIRKLWIPDLTTNRLYGVTSDLGILYRN